MKYKNIAVTEKFGGFVVFELDDGLFCVVNDGGEHRFETNWLFITKWAVLDLTADAPASLIRNAKAAIEKIPEDDEEYVSLKKEIEGDKNFAKSVREYAKEQNHLLKLAKEGKIKTIGDI